MATDSSQMLKAQRICHVCSFREGLWEGGWISRWVVYLCDFVFVGEEDGEDGGAAEKVFDFEGVDVGVVGWFVVVEHEVEGVGLRGEEEQFEDGVVEGAGGKGPEDVEVAG